MNDFDNSVGDFPDFDFEEDTMAAVQQIHNMFNFSFEKPSVDIIAAAKKKIDSIHSKIKEREHRVARVREEYKIDDKALIELLTQARKAAGAGVMSYSVSNSAVGSKMTEDVITVAAGVVNHLLTENDFIEGEKSQAEKLEVIVRNLADIADDNGKPRGHRLSFDELRFLGF